LTKFEWFREGLRGRWREGWLCNSGGVRGDAGAGEKSGVGGGVGGGVSGGVGGGVGGGVEGDMEVAWDVVS
jgi:hypothetical protein